MLHFHPALWRDGELMPVPRPVTLLRVQDAWDALRFKVPLGDGDVSAGWSRNGVEIFLEGQFGSEQGALLPDETTMFLALEAFRARLHAGESAAEFQFFLYHDPDSGIYRSFRRCVAVRFDYDLSDQQRFSYALRLHAHDPRLHLTPPD